MNSEENSIVLLGGGMGEILGLCVTPPKSEFLGAWPGTCKPTASVSSGLGLGRVCTLKPKSHSYGVCKPPELWLPSGEDACLLDLATALSPTFTT